jgi:hypothetical protein
VYATPRWSPDGRWLAVERRAVGGPSAIDLLDAGTLARIATLASTPHGRVTTPAWRSDGKSLLFASDQRGGAFQVFEVAVGRDGMPGTPVARTDVSSGARSPAMLPDGRLVYVGYTIEGEDLFALPLERGAPPANEDQNGAGDTTSAAQAGRPAVGTSVGPPQQAARVADVAYRPWRTLAPRGWLPEVDHRDNRWRLGGSAYGVDVLQRHVVQATATWAVTAGDPGFSSVAPRGRPDWSAAYVYQRWQPALFVVGQDETTVFNAVTRAGSSVPLAQREQQVDVGVLRPFRRIRWFQSVSGAYHLDRTTTTTAAVARTANRSGVRGAWLFSSAKRYGYSISAEDGVSLAATAELQRTALGADGRADAFTADARAYLPVGLPHVIVAVRFAAGTSRGDQDVRRQFRLGGSDGNPTLGAFGSDAVSLLRGFQDDVFAGTHVAVVNLETRVPLLRPQRGLGTWPLFLRAVHASGFLDLGHAWTGAAHWPDRKRGAGAEVSADVVVAYGLPLTWTAGVAWGRDGAGIVPDQREVYFRVGRSF